MSTTDTVAQFVRDTRRAQGLPEKVEDAAFLARVAGIISTRRALDRRVTS
jgi:hypothetical protein